MELLDRSKGQSAIEYLTTYGWMLLVVAIVGGAIFTTVQNSSQVASVSGLANADVQVKDFGITQKKGLEVEMIGATSDQVENANLSIKDEESGEKVYSCSEETIPVADSETVSVAGVESSENTNTYTVEISYDSGGLENLTETGSVTGRMELNESVSCGDIGAGGGGSSGSSDFQLSSVSDNGSVTEGETLGVDYTVNNNGDGSGTQDITLDVSGTQEDVNSSVSLSSSGSSTGTLVWGTESGDAGSGISYTVSTENDSISGSVDVNSLSGPSAVASDNVSQPEAGDTVKFIGSDSTTGSSSDLTYSWDVNSDGSYEYSGSSPNVTHSYSSSGTYSVELNVSDSNGLWDNDSLTLDVQSTTVSRSDAVAAADAWYNVTGSGWEKVKGPANYPNSLSPDSATLKQDYYGPGLDAVQWGGETDIPKVIYSESNGPDNISLATVQKSDASGGVNFGLGLVASDGHGSFSYMDYECGTSFALGYGPGPDFKCLGGDVTNRYVIFQTHLRKPSSAEHKTTISGDISGSRTANPADKREEIYFRMFTQSGGATVTQGPVAVIESEEVPVHVKDYFNENY